MLNHAGRYNWHVHQELLRPSVLGRAASKPQMLRNKRIEEEVDTDEAVPSRTTYDHVRAYLNARDSDDEWGETDALNKVDRAAAGIRQRRH